MIIIITTIAITTVFHYNFAILFIIVIRFSMNRLVIIYIRMVVSGLQIPRRRCRWRHYITTSSIRTFWFVFMYTTASTRILTNKCGAVITIAFFRIFVYTAVV